MRTYVGRLAAELIVIVVGILLALGADALLEQRAERAQERLILRTLEGDLRESADKLRADSEFALERSGTLRGLYDYQATGAGGLTEEQQQDIRIAANVTSAYAPILRAYESLVATGTLKLIRSEEILYGLADVKRSTEEYLNYRDQATNVWLFTLMPVWLEEVGAGGSAELIQAATSRRFRGAIGQRLMFLRFTGERGIKLADRMEVLAARINRELEANQ